MSLLKRLGGPSQPNDNGSVAVQDRVSGSPLTSVVAPPPSEQSGSLPDGLVASTVAQASINTPEPITSQRMVTEGPTDTQRLLEDRKSVV